MTLFHHARFEEKNMGNFIARDFFSDFIFTFIFIYIGLPLVYIVKTNLATFILNTKVLITRKILSSLHSFPYILWIKSKPTFAEFHK